MKRLADNRCELHLDVREVTDIIASEQKVDSRLSYCPLGNMH